MAQLENPFYGGRDNKEWSDDYGRGSDGRRKGGCCSCLIALIIIVVIFGGMGFKEYYSIVGKFKDFAIGQGAQKLTLKRDSEFWKNPAIFAGSKYTFKGKVMTVADGTFTMYIDFKNYKKQLTVQNPEGFAVNYGDFVEVTGEIVNESYPTVSAREIKKIDILDALTSGAKKTQLDQKITENGLTITVEKIARTDEYTFIYLTFENQSTTQLTFYASDLDVSSAGKKYTNDYITDLPYSIEDLKPGETKSAVMVYKALPKKAVGVDLIARVFPDDPDVNFPEFKWSIEF
ncbi:MAG: hypothetical protein LBN08_04345 [Lactobacillales bacterium]|jgi:hypothetical protein|nr:hypothetical protein [Lactobacillales bacterium]